MAEKRAKHLCAFETLGLNARCRKPTQDEVKKAWHKLCMRLHPDKNSDAELATEATRCINLAKTYLFEDFFGDAAARVVHKHTHPREEPSDDPSSSEPQAPPSSSEPQAPSEATPTPEAAADPGAEPACAPAEPTPEEVERKRRRDAEMGEAYGYGAPVAKERRVEQEQQG